MKGLKLNEKNTQNVVVCLLCVAIIYLLYVLYSKRNEHFHTKKYVFYFIKAEWCPHCQQAKPAMKELKSKVPSNVEVVELDSDEDKEKINTMDIEGFPTFKLQKPDGSLVDYEGPREPEPILQFLKQQCN